MRYLLTMTILFTAAVLSAAEKPGAATYVDHDKVNAALAKGGSLADSSGVLVSGSHRTGAGQVEVHEKETDIMYVMDGHATLVTGGTMVGGKVSKPGQMLGSSIQGGEEHHLTKGDVVVVPAGTPHWFKEVPESISYFVVKSVKP